MRNGHITQILQREICKRQLSFEGSTGSLLGKIISQILYRPVMFAIVLNVSTHMYLLTNIFVIKQI